MSKISEFTKRSGIVEPWASLLQKDSKKAEWLTPKGAAYADKASAIEVEEIEEEEVVPVSKPVVEPTPTPVDEETPATEEETTDEETPIEEE
jgi:hypothetical protein